MCGLHWLKHTRGFCRKFHNFYAWIWFLCDYLPNFEAYGVILLLQSEWNQSAAVLTCPTQQLQPIRVEQEESACGAQLRTCIHLHIQEQILEFCHQQQCLFNRFIKIKVTMCLQPKKKNLRRSDMFKQTSEKTFIYMLILVKDAALQNKVQRSLCGSTNA